MHPLPLRCTYIKSPCTPTGQQHFSICCSFCADFLVNLLKGEGQKAWLSTEHAQLRVLHSWFRCLVQMHHPPGAGQQVQRLTQ